MLTFEVKICDDALADCWSGKDFLDLVKEGAVDTLCEQLVDGEVYEQAEALIKETIKLHKQEIIDRVVKEVTEGVTKKIEKSKEVIANTPKASELISINRDNEKYFMELIDKAIAKKFK